MLPSSVHPPRPATSLRLNLRLVPRHVFEVPKPVAAQRVARALTLRARAQRIRLLQRVGPHEVVAVCSKAALRRLAADVDAELLKLGFIQGVVGGVPGRRRPQAETLKHRRRLSCALCGDEQRDGRDVVDTVEGERSRPADGTDEGHKPERHRKEHRDRPEPAGHPRHQERTGPDRPPPDLGPGLAFQLLIWLLRGSLTRFSYVRMLALRAR